MGYSVLSITGRNTVKSKTGEGNERVLPLFHCPHLFLYIHAEHCAALIIRYNTSSHLPPPKTWEQCLPAPYTLNFLSFIQFRLDVGCKYKKKYWNMRTFFHKILHIPIFSCKSCASSTATDGSLQALTWRSDKPHQAVPAPRLLPLPWWVPRYIHG